jgi:hypothetical protein
MLPAIPFGTQNSASSRIVHSMNASVDVIIGTDGTSWKEVQSGNWD